MTGAEEDKRMSELVIPDVDEATVARLRDRAARHGRTIDAEIKAILAEALPAVGSEQWAAINVLREELAASGRNFPDSTPLIREDRNR
jgi:plasmid stability protein